MNPEQLKKKLNGWIDDHAKECDIEIIMTVRKKSHDIENTVSLNVKSYISK